MRSSPKILVRCDDLGFKFGIRTSYFNPPLTGIEYLAARHIHSEVLGIVASKFGHAPFCQPVDDRPDACPVGSARAHAAGLYRRDQGALGEELGLVAQAGFPSDIHLGVANTLVGSVRIAATDENFAVGANQQRAERMVASYPACERDLDGLAQLLNIIVQD